MRFWLSHSIQYKLAILLAAGSLLTLISQSKAQRLSFRQDSILTAWSKTGSALSVSDLKQIFFRPLALDLPNNNLESLRYRTVIEGTDTFERFIDTLEPSCFVADYSLEPSSKYIDTLLLTSVCSKSASSDSIVVATLTKDFGLPSADESNGFVYNRWRTWKLPKMLIRYGYGESGTTTRFVRRKS